VAKGALDHPRWYSRMILSTGPAPPSGRSSAYAVAKGDLDHPRWYSREMEFRARHDPLDAVEDPVSAVPGFVESPSPEA